MNKKMLSIAAFLFVIGLLFAACVEAPLPPEKPIASDGERVAQRTVRKPSSIVPTLVKKVDEESSEYRLESQIATFKNEAKSGMILELADNVSISCEDRQELPEDKQILSIEISRKDGKAIEIGDLVAGGQYDITAKLKKNGGEEILGQISKLEIGTLNDSVVRGRIQIGNESLSFDGEYFAAICK